MAQKVLGLDIGSYSIKGVLLKSRLGGGYEYLDSFYEQIDSREGDRLNSIKVTVRRIVRENNLEGETIVTAAPAQKVISRFLKLPFPDKKKIDQVLSYEIESYIPFSADEIAADYQVLSKSKEGSELFVQVLKKSDVESILEGFVNIGVDIKCLDSEQLALYSAHSQLPKSTYCHAYLDIGHAKTILTIMKGTQIAHSHTIDLAGRHINERISSELSVSMAEADSFKKYGGDHVDEVGRIIHDSFVELSDRIRQHIISFEMAHKINVKELFLTGGSAAYENTELLLSDTLGFSVKTLLFKEIAPGSVENNGQLTSMIAYGLALRLKSTPHTSTVNFKVDKTASNKETKYYIRSLVKAFSMALILLLFYGADLTIKKRDKTKLLMKYESRLSTSFREAFPDVIAKGNELVLIKDKIKEAGVKAGRVGALLNRGRSSLDMLTEMSRRVSQAAKDDEVEIYECAYDGKRINLLGETGSYNLTDSIKKSLEESDMFKEVKMEYAKFTADKKKVKFSMKITLSEKGGR